VAVGTRTAAAAHAATIVREMVFKSSS